jgi:hypothetical protein
MLFADAQWSKLKILTASSAMIATITEQHALNVSMEHDK